LERRGLPYEEPEPTTDTDQDPCDQSQLYAVLIAIIGIIGIAVGVAPAVLRPSASKDISSIYEGQDGKDEIHEKADYDRKLEEDHKGR
jgi:hypothetical protein